MARDPKGRKVKRNKNIYSNTSRRKKQKGAKVVGIVLVCVAMIFIGYSAAGPIKQFLEGDFDKKPSQEIEKSSSQHEQSQVISSQPEQPKPEEKENDNLEISDIKGVYLPIEIMKKEEDFLAFLDMAEEKGINTIVFNLKDQNGFIHYNSNLESVIASEAKVVDALELSYILEKITEKKMTAIPRVFAFNDPIASRRLGDAFVRYGSADGLTWLDDSLANGGRASFSPEKPIAQQYIKDIVKEISDAGFSDIMIDGVQYPFGLSLNMAYFGERSKTDKLGVLNDFLLSLEETLGEQSRLHLVNTVQSLVYGDEAFYGGNPGGLNIKGRVFTVFPSVLPEPLIVGETTILLPKSEPEVVTRLMVEAAMKSIVIKNGTNLVFLQNFDGYEDGAVNEQIKALDAGVINGYVLYNEQGLYK